MHRNKKHKIKHEKPETSSAFVKRQEDYDLTYYIHDRVELMHQVFSVLKHKDLKAIAPECVRHISIDDLQELCTEELLGISSKRLCAILDGAEPPSDTESSSASQSPERFETISLDSISSDDEVLSLASSKKSKKHKHHRSKAKKSKKRADEPPDAARASRAGLTVLELLELQARARAIRAQLQNEQAAKQAAEPSAAGPSDDDDDVEIKEEPADVVEISDDDDKSALAALRDEINKTTEQNAKENASNSTTKVVNTLTITVPQQTQSRKIKLKRNKAPTVASVDTTAKEKAVGKEKPVTRPAEVSTDKPNDDSKDKQKRRKKKNKKKAGSDDDEITLQLSDTEKMDLLEDLDRKNYDKLSSSSEDSESSSETSDSDDEKAKTKTKAVVKAKDKTSKSQVAKSSTSKENTAKDVVTNAIVIENTDTPEGSFKQTISSEANVNSSPKNTENDKEPLNKDNLPSKETEVCVEINAHEKSDVSDKNVTQDVEKNISKDNESQESSKVTEEKDTQNVIDVTSVSDIPLASETESSSEKKENAEVSRENNKVETVPTETGESKSDGELSDRASSEIEAYELKPEVVCISDEEGGKKKKKKKEKKSKSKKEKKSKKSKSDFREGGDQNFYKKGERDKTSPIKEVEIHPPLKEIEITSPIKEAERNPPIIEVDISSPKNEEDLNSPSKEISSPKKEKDITSPIKVEGEDSSKQEIDSGSVKELEIKSPKKESEISSPINIDDDLYEILELSDDSSCYEVEGMLSKEPTAAEIEALSAKIDEIERDDIITDEEIREHERVEAEKNLEEVSWKDRYVESKKVKKVMSTSNIFNLLRKKNRELKKKLQESKTETEEKVEDKVPVESETVEEGTIEHFNMLQGSTKYVDPVAEPEKVEEKKEQEKTEEKENTEENSTEDKCIVSKAMKKDAKQLLKMYKKLLMYNDMTRGSDPSKKKKKSKKKRKNSGDANTASQTPAELAS